MKSAKSRRSFCPDTSTHARRRRECLGRRGQRRGRATGRLTLEPLESRTLLAVDLTGVPDWIEQGPGPIDTTGVSEFGAEHEEAGAINGIAADPTDANRIFVGTVNGGVWRTTTGTYSTADSVDNDGDVLVDEADEFPHWTPLTDQFGSLSVGAVSLSLLDPNTVFAGSGRFSSGFGDGGAQIGILKSTDGGDTWAPVGENDELGRVEHLADSPHGDRHARDAGRARRNERRTVSQRRRGRHVGSDLGNQRQFGRNR